MESKSCEQGNREYFEKGWTNLVNPPQKEDLDMDELLVYPWCGVVCNISTVRDDSGHAEGPGVDDLLKYFSVFHPQDGHVLRGSHGHLGLAVIHFRKCLEGYKNGRAFERWFQKRGQSKKDWMAKKEHEDGVGLELYGWLAREEEYSGRSPVDERISTCLQFSSTLADLATLVYQQGKEQYHLLSGVISRKSEQVNKLNVKLEEKEHILETVRSEKQAIEKVLETEKAFFRDCFDKQACEHTQRIKDLQDHWLNLTEMVVHYRNFEALTAQSVVQGAALTHSISELQAHASRLQRSVDNVQQELANQRVNSHLNEQHQLLNQHAYSHLNHNQLMIRQGSTNLHQQRW